MLLLASPTPSQDWALHPATGPGGRQLARMVFDLSRGEAVMFGGYTTITNSALDETWTFDGTTWTLKAPATRPSPRDTFALSYDLQRGVTSMFGGVDSANFPASITSETWEWNGVDWTLRTPAQSPVARFGCAMAYDTLRGVHVMFGGSSSSAVFNDTWEWDGVNWVQRTPGLAPPARSGHTMVFDQARGLVVLFGGSRGNVVFGDTWVYDGSTWREITVQPAPAARRGHVAAYDVLRQVTVISQGLGAGSIRLADTFEFDGTYWHRYRNGAAPSAAGRVNSAMAYDLLRQRSFLFGGAGSFANPVDTAEFRSDRPSFTQYATGCAGTVGTPVLDSTTLPAVAGTLQMQLTQTPGTAATVLILGTSTASGLMIPGSTCGLFVSAQFATLGVTATGGSAGYPLTIPNNPTLSGLRLFAQGAVVDPGAVPLGLTVTNGARFVIH